jgi:paraquat-inducible protein A
VELGFVTSVAAGPAINYFTLTVIFTMIAANSFDPRLLWDKKQGCENDKEENDY